MGRITIDQSHQIVATLATNADWDDIDFELAGLQDAVIRNPKEAGCRFTAFLKNGARLVVVEPKIIPIDRSTPLNPEKLLGKGWTIWRGPSDGNGLEGEEEQDKRSLAITKLDLSKIQLVTTLRKGENVVNGEENLRRLREANHICLDAGVFQTFWKNQALTKPLFKELTERRHRPRLLQGDDASRPERQPLCPVPLLRRGQVGLALHLARPRLVRLRSVRGSRKSVLGYSPQTGGAKPNRRPV